MTGDCGKNLWYALAQAIPEDLNANRKEDERRDPRHDVGSCFSQSANQAVRSSVTIRNQDAKKKRPDQSSNEMARDASFMSPMGPPRVTAIEIQPGPTVIGS